MRFLISRCYNEMYITYIMYMYVDFFATEFGSFDVRKCENFLSPMYMYVYGFLIYNINLVACMVYWRVDTGGSA